MENKEYPTGHPLYGWSPYPKREESPGSLDFMNLETGRLRMAEAPCAGCAGLRKVLEALLADPHGCSFCDWGELRTPNDPRKDHDADCLYVKARAALAEARRGG